jgi:methionyl-tRNA synthetase
MSNRRFYVTTSIPYVNGDPHVGFALECVQADVATTSAS